jgi:hypothetical protein
LICKGKILPGSLAQRQKAQLVESLATVAVCDARKVERSAAADQQKKSPANARDLPFFSNA